jgi:hypothetical protein
MKELHLMQRREFLLQSGWMLAGLAVSAAFPASLLAATPAACYVDASRYPDACGDWTVDHVCSHWPPYTFDTGAARPHTQPLDVAAIDRHWVM